MIGALILLVNDIPDHAEVYRSALLEVGFRVMLVMTGAEALASASAAPPDCAVIDVRLPDMRGWDLCKELKAGPAGDVPIVLLAPEVSRQNASESANVGCNAWLAHPTIADDLVRAVRHVLASGESKPASADEAVLGVRTCPACAGERLKATLRMRLIQYFCCRDCGFSWRIDSEPA
jgi:two-component system, OmpR family, phosphate regulon response regulator PhoB